MTISPLSWTRLDNRRRPRRSGPERATVAAVGHDVHYALPLQLHQPGDRLSTSSDEHRTGRPAAEEPSSYIRARWPRHSSTRRLTHGETFQRASAERSVTERTSQRPVRVGPGKLRYARAWVPAC